MTAQLVRTAFHEAGHTVWRFGVRRLPIGVVSIVPDQDSRGRVMPIDWTPAREDDLRARVAAAPMDRYSAWVLAQAALAGLAAEAVHIGTRAQWPAPEFAEAFGYLDRAWSSVAVGSVFRDAWIATCDWLAHPIPWAGVTALAEALLKHRELDGDRALDIVLAAMRAAHFTRTEEEVVCSIA